MTFREFKVFFAQLTACYAIVIIIGSLVGTVLIWTWKPWIEMSPVASFIPFVVLWIASVVCSSFLIPLRPLFSLDSPWWKPLFALASWTTIWIWAGSIAYIVILLVTTTLNPHDKRFFETVILSIGMGVATSSLMTCSALIAKYKQ